MNRYGFTPVSPIADLQATPAAPIHAGDVTGARQLERDSPRFWAAVGQIGRQLVDVLTDDVDVAEAKRLISGAEDTSPNVAVRQ